MSNRAFVWTERARCPSEMPSSGREPRRMSPAGTETGSHVQTARLLAGNDGANAMRDSGPGQMTGRSKTRSPLVSRPGLLGSLFTILLAPGCFGERDDDSRCDMGLIQSGFGPTPQVRGFPRVTLGLSTCVDNGRRRCLVSQ
jgi:hypothetical protein